MKPESAHTQLSTQEAYVKEHKRYHNKITLCRLTIFLLFLTVWELAADLKRIDAFFFSSPSRVLTCLLELVTEKNLFLHIGITLYETIISFLLVFLFSGILPVKTLPFSATLANICPFLPNIFV